ncbi:hypothetical protein P3X46_028074 [Hevea brasiliensis]|uniref:ARC6 IMS domain-containing protein n=1 Tax=Hevea brasiliensis TaxID=3981 RepID=A0ABQ9KQX1_HEVBR|nr:plastid division protein CDP1, chloroplastic isoform X2 [Hevea brasiliensis]KAJ9145728.1 hypothetical protein P3X46_028074 [Hevea brasiliensis]
MLFPRFVSENFQRRKTVQFEVFKAKMALAHAKSIAILLPPRSPSHFKTRFLKHVFPFCLSNSRFSISLSRVFDNGDFTPARSILSAAVTRIVDNVPALTPTTTSPTVEIPITCYQLIGVPDQAEKDEIVKSVMQLKSADVEEGYTMEAVISRQDLLMDVRDKLLFEPEYAGSVREKIPPKASLRIPWAWLSGALCLLQEAGEDKLVLDIGRSALQHPDAKPYIHDLLLSMALAECAIAKIGFEKNKVAHGFEALARAQCLLRSKISLEKVALLYEIEDSLEELAPACTLELLGMPHSSDNAERRRGAIAALRELLRQGLDVETSCRVQDWPGFLNQALSRLMAIEIVDLLPWDDLALIRKNKKSLESQNQRVVIDFNCFSVALIAHISVGFSSRQTELINKAKILCECLMTSEGIDLKFEEALCLFLLGQGNEAQVVEKFHQLELNSNPASRSLLPGKEITDVSGTKPSLETWLKDSVLSVFPDTRDCSPSLVKFFGDEKRTPGNKKGKVSPQMNTALDHKPLSVIALKQMDHGESLPNMNSTQHFGSAVKQLAPTDLRSSLTLGKNVSGGNVNESSVQLKRILGAQNTRGWESWLTYSDVVRKITFVGVLSFILFFTFKLSGMNLRRTRIASKLAFSKPRMNSSSLVCATDLSFDCNVEPAYIGGSSIAGRMKKLLATIRKQFQNQSDPRKLHSAGLAANHSSLMTTISRKQMPVEEAEALVKQWQEIKAEALGPSHQVHSLSEVLDGSMLAQWQSLANAAKAKPCYWRFVLLKLAVLQADTLLDEYGVEMAEIEALLEEAAQLVDEFQEKNPNYYSIYKIHYVLKRHDDGSWKFCEGDIQTPL